MVSASLAATVAIAAPAGAEGPHAAFDFDPGSPLISQEVTFTSSSSSDNEIVSEEWDFEDDGTFDESGSSALHSFSTAGAHTVRLKVTDAQGLTSEAAQTVTVTVPNEAPVAAFEFLPAGPHTLDTVTFTSTSTDDSAIATAQWDLDNDGTFEAAGNQVTRMFLFAGNYTVTLRVTDDQGVASTTSRIVTVSIPPNLAPLADFSFAPAGPRPFDNVVFTSTSTDEGTIAAEQWDLDGDGSFELTAHQAQRAFPAPGSYSISLRVTDDRGGSAVRTRVVTVVAAVNPPIPAFRITPTNPKSGTSISFRSDSTDNGSIVQTQWDFDNDGAFDATGSQVQRTFAVPGSYPVRLRVTDDDGGKAELVQAISVANREPIADFTFAPSSPQRGQLVSFSSTSTDPEDRLQSLSWDLDGDGEFDDAAGTTAARAFSAAGSHTVGLRVTDQDGGVATTTKTVTVPNAVPVVAFAFTPASPLTGQPVRFTSTATDDSAVVSEQWDLDGNGTFEASGREVERTYATAGTYAIKLKVTDDEGGTATATRSLTVSLPPNVAPHASFQFSPAEPSTGDVVTFTSDSSDEGSIALAQWDFGNDGTVDATGTSVQRSFALPAGHAVRLRVTDDRGATDEVVRTVQVANRAPTSAFGFSPATPHKNETITFTSSASDPESRIDRLEWDLDGDGSYDDAIGTTAARSFATVGARSIGLKVTDKDGGTDTSTKTVTVANQQPVAAFGYSPESPQVLSAVTFTSAATDDGSIVSEQWDLDDNGTFEVTGHQAQKVFLLTGDHVVRLKVTDDDGATSTSSQTVRVGLGPNQLPRASFGFSPSTPKTAETITFTSTSTDEGAVVLTEWDFGNDGTFDAIGTTAQRAFAVPGSHAVRMRVTDDRGGSDQETVVVTVANRLPSAGFGFAPATPHKNEPITFTSSASDPENRIDKLEWDLDADGQFDDASGMTASRSFVTIGAHSIGLKVTDRDGGTDSFTRAVTVSNEAPKPAFTYTPTAPQALASVTFTSSSTDDGSIVAEQWDLDDNGTFEASGRQVQKIFAFAGDHTVRLKVTDDDGTVATGTQTVEVALATNVPPVAAFHFAPLAPKSGESIAFTSDSTDEGAIALVQWDFTDDGSFDATGNSVQHAFALPGTYSVRIRVTDDRGGASEKTATLAVANRPPASAFTHSPASPLKNETITFSSTASDPESRIQVLQWDLDGDGQYNDASGLIATRAFTTAGPHTVGLRVVDSDGGTDTVTKVVTVQNRDPVASFDYSPASPSSFDEISFTSTSTDPDPDDIVRTDWDVDNDGFDDGTGVQMVRPFSTPGARTIRVRVTDSSGATAIGSRTVTVANLAPIARFGYLPAVPQKNQAVTFASSSSDRDGSIAKSEWDFNGDGVWDKTGASVQNTFTAVGLYVVRLRVTDNSGATDEFALALSIGGNAAPTASIGFTPDNALTGQTVTFTADASDPDGSVSKLEWDLDGDGNFDDGGKQSMTMQYSTPGPRTIGLRVTDNEGANGFAQRQITIANRAPQAVVTVSTATPLRGQPVTLDASGSSDPDGLIANVEWDLDHDGSYDQQGMLASIAHSTLGEKPFAVRVTDGSGATHVAEGSITVVNASPVVDFSMSPVTPAAGETVDFFAVASDLDGTVAEYRWDFNGDGTTDATGPVAHTRFSSIGTKTVTVRVTDNDGDVAVASRSLRIGNRSPVASFELRPAAPIAGQAVTFFSTSSDQDNNLEAASWDLDGDGSFETPGHSAGRTFDTPGTYTVNLRVTDSEGLTSIATQTIAVTAPVGVAPAPTALGEAPQLRLLTPFPIVRMAGRIGSAGTRFRVLSVDAPAGAVVTVRCRGRSCPFRSSARTSSANRVLRLSSLERRLLRTGVTVEILVTKPGVIGKYTSITIRSGKPPRRTDRCVMPGTSKPVQCSA